MFKKLNFILLLLFIALFVGAQEIPNYGFEIWSTDGPYEITDSWSSSNDFTWQINNTVGIVSSVQSYEGNYSAHLVTTNIGFAGLPYAGWLVNGMPQLDIATGEVDFFKAGTEFSEKPNVLRGFYIYENNYVTIDSANVFVVLKKFNTVTNQSDTIGYGSVKLGPTVGFSDFEVFISDISPGVLPDSMIIAFTTTDIYQPVSGASLWLDDLNFDNLSGNVENEVIREVKSYPNPAIDKIFIEYQGYDKQLSVNIYNFVGQLVKLSRISNVNDKFEIRVNDLPEGAYMLEIKSGGKHIQTQKLLIRRS